MRRYELPMDDFLRHLKSVLVLNNVKHLWTCEEFNGVNMSYMPGFFCDGSTEAAENIMVALKEDKYTRKLDIPCCTITERESNGLYEVYSDGKFYSALNDITDYGNCSGVVLEDNEFLVGFRERLKAIGAEYVWVQGRFTGEKLPGVMYNIDSYNVPWSMCEYVDPYADNDEVYSDVRSYCVSTNHTVPTMLNLIYNKGVFYEGR